VSRPHGGEIFALGMRIVSSERVGEGAVRQDVVASEYQLGATLGFVLRATP
jgi:hypothetical protein